MVDRNQSDLLGIIATGLADNTSGAITAQILRDIMTDTVDTIFTVTSASGSTTTAIGAADGETSIVLGNGSGIHFAAGENVTATLSDAGNGSGIVTIGLGPLGSFSENPSGLMSSFKFGAVDANGQGQRVTIHDSSGIMLKAGSNMSIDFGGYSTADSGVFTFNAVLPSGNAITSVSIAGDTGYTWSGQTAASGAIVAGGAADTLTLVAGTGIHMRADSSNNAILIANSGYPPTSSAIGFGDLVLYDASKELYRSWTGLKAVGANGNLLVGHPTTVQLTGLSTGRGLSVFGDASNGLGNSPSILVHSQSSSPTTLGGFIDLSQGRGQVNGSMEGPSSASGDICGTVIYSCTDSANLNAAFVSAVQGRVVNPETGKVTGKLEFHTAAGQGSIEPTDRTRAMVLDELGNLDVSGVVRANGISAQASGLRIGGTAVTSSAAELNLLDGVTALGSGTMSKFHVGINGSSLPITDGSGLFFAGGSNISVGMTNNNGSGILTFNLVSDPASSGNAFGVISTSSDVGYTWNTASNVTAIADGQALNIIPASGIRIDTDNTNSAIRIGVSGTLPDLESAPNLESAANLSTIGTITTGTWNADTITVSKGGTGSTSFGAGEVIFMPDVGTALSSSSRMKFDGQTFTITHTAGPGITLENTNSDEDGGLFKFNKDGSSPATNDAIGTISWASEDSTGNGTTYAKLMGTIADVDAGSEQGAMKFFVAELDGTLTEGMRIEGANSDGDVTVDIATHDGANGGLKLGGTLVTATAAEINALDGFAGSSIGSGTMSKLHVGINGSSESITDGSGLMFVAGDNMTISLGNSDGSGVLTFASSASGGGSGSGTMSKFHVGATTMPQGTKESITDGSGLFFAAGDNMTITLTNDINGSGVLTFASSASGGGTATSGNAFANVSIAGDTGYTWAGQTAASGTVVAAGDASTLTLVAGTGIHMRTDSSNNAILIANSGYPPTSSATGFGDLVLYDTSKELYRSWTGLRAVGANGNLLAGHPTTVQLGIDTGRGVNIFGDVSNGLSNSPSLLIHAQAGTPTSLGAFIDLSQGKGQVDTSMEGPSSASGDVCGTVIYSCTDSANASAAFTSAIQGRVINPEAGKVSGKLEFHTAAGQGNTEPGNRTRAMILDENGVLDVSGVVKGYGISAQASGLRIGGVAVTSSAAELNILDGVTANATELNYVDGVTSSIQTQLDAKGSGTMSRLKIGASDGLPQLQQLGDGSGLFFAAGDNMTIALTNNDAGSGIITFSSAVPVNNPTFTGNITIGSAEISETELEILDGATLTTTELNYVDGVTSAIQTQLDTKGSGTMSKIHVGINGSSQSIIDGSGLMFVAGDNMTISLENSDGSGILTFASSSSGGSASSGNAFSSVSIAGDTGYTWVGQTAASGSVTAGGDADTLTLVAGTGIHMRADSNNNALLIAASGFPPTSSATGFGDVVLYDTSKEMYKSWTGLRAVGANNNLLAGHPTTVQLGIDTGRGVNIFGDVSNSLTNSPSILVHSQASSPTSLGGFIDLSQGRGQIDTSMEGPSSASGDACGTVIYSCTDSANATAAFVSAVQGRVINPEAGKVSGKLEFHTARGKGDTEPTDRTRAMVLNELGNLDVSGVVRANGISAQASGLRIGGVAVTSSAAELNILDGVTATSTELNIMDAGATVTTPTVAGGDAFVMNDADVGMRQVDIDNVDTYLAATTKTLTNKTLTSPTITSPTITGTTALASGVTIGLQANDTSDNYSLEVAGQIKSSGVITPPITASDAATVTFDLKQSNFHMLTLQRASTTLVFADAQPGQRFLARLTQDGTGGRNVVFPGGISWARAAGQGTPPPPSATAGHSTMYGFICTSGVASARYYDGFLVGSGIQGTST